MRAVQLREKDLPVRDQLALAKDLREITREFGAKLFINDRVDVAVAVDADGVHLGSQSIPARAVRKIVGPGMLIGVSTHSEEEARLAVAEGADFITLGPLFETPSKKQYGDPVGLSCLNSVKNKITIPIFGIGGVKSGNIIDIIASGAFGIALVSGILASDDIKNSAEEAIRIIHEVLAV